MVKTHQPVFQRYPNIMCILSILYHYIPTSPIHPSTSPNCTPKWMDWVAIHASIFIFSCWSVNAIFSPVPGETCGRFQPSTGTLGYPLVTCFAGGSLSSMILPAINSIYLRGFSKPCLVGGLDFFLFSIYPECHHPNWRSPSFFRWVETTNQSIIQ
jgi:hypothetical protein